MALQVAGEAFEGAGQVAGADDLPQGLSGKRDRLGHQHLEPDAFRRILFEGIVAGDQIHGNACGVLGILFVGRDDLFHVAGKGIVIDVIPAEGGKERPQLRDDVSHLVDIHPVQGLAKDIVQVFGVHTECDRHVFRILGFVLLQLVGGDIRQGLLHLPAGRGEAQQRRRQNDP